MEQLNPVQKADLEAILQRTLLRRRPAVVRAWLGDRAPKRLPPTDQQAFWRWERGFGDPAKPPKQVVAIADALGLDRDWFTEDTA